MAQPAVLSPERRAKLFGIECPSALLFSDWRPDGRVYTHRLVLKNVGRALQTLTFRLPAVSSFFTQFPDPIVLPVGVAHALTVSFQPTTLAELDTVLVFHSSLADDDFAVRLTAELPLLSCALDASVDLAEPPTAVAEESVARRTLCNDGEVPFSFRLEALAPFAVAPQTGTLHPGQTLPVDFRFAPAEAGSFSGEAVLSVRPLAADALAKAGVVQKTVDLRGVAKYPFVRMTAEETGRPLVDLRGTLVHERPRAALVLENDSPVAFSYTLEPSWAPAAGAGAELALSQRGGRLEAHSRATVVLAYTPSASQMFHNAADAAVHETVRLLTRSGAEATLEVVASAVPAPLALSETKIDLGAVCFGETVSRTIQVRNLSRHDCPFAFSGSFLREDWAPEGTGTGAGAGAAVVAAHVMAVETDDLGVADMVVPAVRSLPPPPIAVSPASGRIPASLTLSVQIRASLARFSARHDALHDGAAPAAAGAGYITPHPLAMYVQLATPGSAPLFLLLTATLLPDRGVDLRPAPTTLGYAERWYALRAAHDIDRLLAPLVPRVGRETNAAASPLYSEADYPEFATEEAVAGPKGVRQSLLRSVADLDSMRDALRDRDTVLAALPPDDTFALEFFGDVFCYKGGRGARMSARAVDFGYCDALGAGGSAGPAGPAGAAGAAEPAEDGAAAGSAVRLFHVFNESHLLPMFVSWVHSSHRGGFALELLGIVHDSAGGPGGCDLHDASLRRPCRFEEGDPVSLQMALSRGLVAKVPPRAFAVYALHFRPSAPDEFFYATFSCVCVHTPLLVYRYMRHAAVGAPCFFRLVACGTSRPPALPSLSAAVPQLGAPVVAADGQDLLALAPSAPGRVTRTCFPLYNPSETPVLLSLEPPACPFLYVQPCIVLLQPRGTALVSVGATFPLDAVSSRERYGLRADDRLAAGGCASVLLAATLRFRVNGSSASTLVLALRVPCASPKLVLAASGGAGARVLLSYGLRGTHASRQLHAQQASNILGAAGAAAGAGTGAGAGAGNAVSRWDACESERAHEGEEGASTLSPPSEGMQAADITVPGVALGAEAFHTFVLANATRVPVEALFDASAYAVGSDACPVLDASVAGSAGGSILSFAPGRVLVPALARVPVRLRVSAVEAVLSAQEYTFPLAVYANVPFAVAPPLNLACYAGPDTYPSPAALVAQYRDTPLLPLAQDVARAACAARAAPAAGRPAGAAAAAAALDTSEVPYSLGPLRDALAPAPVRPCSPDAYDASRTTVFGSQAALDSLLTRGLLRVHTAVAPRRVALTPAILNLGPFVPESTNVLTLRLANTSRCMVGYTIEVQEVLECMPALPGVDAGDAPVRRYRFEPGASGSELTVPALYNRLHSPERLPSDAERDRLPSIFVRSGGAGLVLPDSAAAIQLACTPHRAGTLRYRVLVRCTDVAADDARPAAAWMAEHAAALQAGMAYVQGLGRHVSALRARQPERVLAASIEVRAAYPKFFISEASCPKVGSSQLRDMLDVDSINEFLGGAVSPAEVAYERSVLQRRQYQQRLLTEAGMGTAAATATGAGATTAAAAATAAGGGAPGHPEGLALLKTFPVVLGPDNKSAQSKAYRVILSLANPGPLPCELSVTLPHDEPSLEGCPWARGLPPEPQQRAMDLLAKGIFVVAPERVALAPGEKRALTISYAHIEEGVHELAVLVAVRGGRRMILHLIGQTLSASEPTILAPVECRLLPVCLGDPQPPRQVLRLTNPGQVPVSYRVLRPELVYYAEGGAGAGSGSSGEGTCGTPEPALPESVVCRTQSRESALASASTDPGDSGAAQSVDTVLRVLNPTGFVPANSTISIYMVFAPLALGFVHGRLGLVIRPARARDAAATPGGTEARAEACGGPAAVRHAYGVDLPLGDLVGVHDAAAPATAAAAAVAVADNPHGPDAPEHSAAPLPRPSLGGDAIYQTISVIGYGFLPNQPLPREIIPTYALGATPDAPGCGSVTLTDVSAATQSVLDRRSRAASPLSGSRASSGAAPHGGGGDARGLARQALRDLASSQTGVGLCTLSCGRLVLGAVPVLGYVSAVVSLHASTVGPYAHNANLQRYPDGLYRWRAVAPECDGSVRITVVPSSGTLRPGEGTVLLVEARTSGEPVVLIDDIAFCVSFEPAGGAAQYMDRLASRLDGDAGGAPEAPGGPGQAPERMPVVLANTIASAARVAETAHDKAFNPDAVTRAGINVEDRMQRAIFHGVANRAVAADTADAATPLSRYSSFPLDDVLWLTLVLHSHRAEGLAGYADSPWGLRLNRSAAACTTLLAPPSVQGMQDVQGASLSTVEAKSVDALADLAVRGIVSRLSMAQDTRSALVASAAGAPRSAVNDLARANFFARDREAGEWMPGTVPASADHPDEGELMQLLSRAVYEAV